MEPSIVVCGVDKEFRLGQRRTPILHGINLEVERGEVVFLVGPSGSGKTTLLSLLGCLLTPDRGTIRILGREVSKESPASLEAFRLAHLGFVFQTFNLFPTLSALDNVRLALCMRGLSARTARDRAAELLQHVGLEHRSWLRPTRLSTGECQRVAVARALANEPAILLADEPTAALDAENGQAVMRLLTRLTEERGVTLVIVTHDNRILPYADRILRLEDGYLTQVQEVSIATADAEVLGLASSRMAMESAPVPRAGDTTSAPPRVVASLTSSPQSALHGPRTESVRQVVIFEPDGKEACSVALARAGDDGFLQVQEELVVAAVECDESPPRPAAIPVPSFAPPGGSGTGPHRVLTSPNSSAPSLLHYLAPWGGTTWVALPQPEHGDFTQVHEVVLAAADNDLLSLLSAPITGETTAARGDRLREKEPSP